MANENERGGRQPPPRRVPIFFYGLFMDAELLRRQGVEPVDPRRAEVRGMALRLGARATLVPSAAGTCHGVLMDLTHDEIHRLYSEPSVAMYRPEAVSARLPDGAMLPAICFNLPTVPEPGEGNRDYARRLAAVGRKVGLPADYLAELERHAAGA